MIYRIYRHILPGAREARELAYVWNLIRKCWYKARWLQECSQNKKMQVNTPNDCSISMTNRGNGNGIEHRLSCVSKLKLNLQ
jgi:hypothetical protein